MQVRLRVLWGKSLHTLVGHSRAVCDRWCRNLLGFAVISNHGTCDGLVRSGCSVRVVATAPYWTDDLL